MYVTPGTALDYKDQQGANVDTIRDDLLKKK